MNGNPIDFTRSLPPVPEGLGAAIGQALQAVAGLDLEEVGRASRPAGRGEDRAAAAAWLTPRFGEALDPERLLITNSTQSAVLLLLQTFVPTGKRLVAEVLSYGVLRALADIARVPVEGLPIDAEGLMPDALDRAARAGGVGAIYCNPTFHNPTAVVMGHERRAAIARVARHHGLPIIEDDPLGLLDPMLPRPVASFAPELTWHIATLTKTIAQGMRVAYLLCPSASEAARFVEPYVRLSHWVAAPLMGAAATWLIESGTGDRIRSAIAAENLARETIARGILGPAGISGATGSPHLWLPMPEDRAAEIAAQLQADGVLVRGQELFRVDDGVAAPSGIRLSLSSPASRDLVLAGLEAISHRLAPFSTDILQLRKQVR